jgi:hypothetical protein
VKSKARFLPFVLALALLTSLFVLSQATAATGSVALDKNHIKAPGGMVGITVSDPAANVGIVEEESEGAGMVSFVIPGRTIAGNEAVRFRTARSPILSSSAYDLTGEGEMGDSNIGVDYRDVVLSLVYGRYETTTNEFIDMTPPADVMAAWEALTVQSTVGGDGRHPFSLENPQGGAFILRAANDVDVPAGGIKFTATYKAPDTQTETVRITSTQDPAGFDISVMETGADTGVFTGSFTTADASDMATNSIAAISGSLITVTYEDAGGDQSRDSVTVENTAPDVTLIAPDDGYATQIRGVRLSAQVTDTESGIKKDTITFHVSGTDVGTKAPEPGVAVNPESQTDVEITGGYRSEAQLHGVPSGVTSVEWYVTVEDNAGNMETSDTWSIRVDTQAPVLESAITGQHLNADGDIVTDASSADPTSVRVDFDEDVDADSLQATDFRVDDIVPADVSSSGSSVFLTVGAMASHETPDVTVVGAVADTAGNVTTGTPEVTAADGIAPTLTVETDPDYAKSEVEIRVRSDESLLTLPSITITDGDGNDASGGLGRLTLIAPDHYTATYSSSDASRFEVMVSGKDTRDNEASVGDVAFEIDNALPMPTSITLPGHADPITELSGSYGITTSNPFITIEWDSEGSEYEGDSHGAVDVTGLMFGDFEVNTPMGDEGGVRSDWGDDSPVVFNVTKPSENRLLISARSLAIGTYTMTFNGSDELGNALGDAVSIDIEVKEPDPFSITLTPGWNLVSLPAEPQMSGINDVMGDHAASIVLTYDPTQPGAWLSASRPGAGEPFAGSLDSISARTAYWVFTDSFDSLSVPVTRPTGGGVTLLPTVNLVAGWNILPVLDVSGGAAFGDDASSVGDYVSNVVRTYAYNASSDTFNQHTGALQVGHGYWAYLSSATVLVP